MAIAIKIVVKCSACEATADATLDVKPQDLYGLELLEANGIDMPEGWGPDHAWVQPSEDHLCPACFAMRASTRHPPARP